MEDLVEGGEEKREHHKGYQTEAGKEGRQAWERLVGNKAIGNKQTENRGLYTAPHIPIRLNQTLIWLEHQQFFKLGSNQVQSDSEVSPINYSDSDQIFSLGSNQNPSNY